MEAIPVEIVGKILSSIAAARDVIVASTVCKKWWEATRRHLRCLQFSGEDSPFSSTSELEILITQTILQTSNLSHLSLNILPSTAHSFSPAPVIAWLLFTRESLNSLCYMIDTEPEVSVLDRCGRARLESLTLGYVTISHIDPGIHKFPALKNLTLKQVRISSLDLNLLLTGCPVLENLSVSNSDNPPIADVGAKVELSCPCLKSISFDDLNLDTIQVVVDSGKLESLKVRYSTFEHLELRGKRSLRTLQITHCNIFHLDVGDAEELEVVEITGFTPTWLKLHQMLLRASRLRSLRLWGVSSREVFGSLVDLQTLARSFPLLGKLAVMYDVMSEEVVAEALGGGAEELRSVCVLEVGSEVVNEVSARWIGALVERCPRLRRLVICGKVSEALEADDFQRLAEFTSSIVDLMRRYMQVQIQFHFY